MSSVSTIHVQYGNHVTTGPAFADGVLATLRTIPTTVYRSIGNREVKLVLDDPITESRLKALIDSIKNSNPAYIALLPDVAFNADRTVALVRFKVTVPNPFERSSNESTTTVAKL